MEGYMNMLVHTMDCEAGDSSKEYVMHVLRDIARDKRIILQSMQDKLRATADGDDDVVILAKTINTLHHELVALRQAAKFIAVRREHAK